MERLSSLQEPPSVQSNLEVLRTYKWLIITTSLVGAIIAAIAALGAIPIYRASAKLLIERTAPQVVKVPDLLPTEEALATDFYPTQYGILKSYSLAREVVTNLDLQQHPEFVGTPEEKSSGLLGSIQGGLRGLLGSIQGGMRGMLDGIGIAPAARQHPAIAIGADTQEHQIVEAFLGRLKVDPVRNSRLVTISFDGRDPALIAQIVNTLAEAYMNLTIELKLHTAQAAMQWLRDKVGEERQKIEQAERALQAFRERENILSAQGSEEVLSEKARRAQRYAHPDAGQAAGDRQPGTAAAADRQRPQNDGGLPSGHAKSIHSDPQVQLCHAGDDSLRVVGPVRLQASRPPA